MEQYKKLQDMESKKWISKHCPHLDKPSQKIGLYELCLVMEQYHKHKSTTKPQRAKKNKDGKICINNLRTQNRT